jgi:ankyrin repeat protein
MYASQEGNVETIKELAKITGINPNLKTTDGTTALSLAKNENTRQCLKNIFKLE